MNRKERDTGSVGWGWGAVDAGGSGRGSPIAQEEEFYFSPMDVGGHGRVLSNRITFLPCLGWHCPPLAEAPAQSTPSEPHESWCLLSGSCSLAVPAKVLTPSTLTCSSGGNFLPSHLLGQLHCP